VHVDYTTAEALHHALIVIFNGFFQQDMVKAFDFLSV
jgi:hypothetical protein